MKKSYVIPVLWFIGGLGIYFLLMELLLYVESSNPDQQIKSLGDAIWFTFVTITTLGYGDVLPITTAGKFVSSIFIIFGVFFLGIIISRIGNIFSEYKERKKMGLYGTNFSDHIVIIGWDKFSEMIVDELIATERKVAIVTDQQNDVDFIYEKYGKKSVFILYSSLTNYKQLDLVNIKESQIVFINFDNDSQKLVYILNLKRRYPDSKFMVSLDETELKDTFSAAGVTFVLSKNEMASKLIASYIFEPNVASYTTDLLDSAKSEDDYDIQEYEINVQNAYANKKYGDVFFEIKKKYKAVLIGIAKNGLIHKLPEDDLIIQNGDSLIMVCNGSMANLIQQDFGVNQGK